jgi:hypothetical protein
MFEDLIPAASTQTPPPPGMFDDLIPAGGAARSSTDNCSGLGNDPGCALVAGRDSPRGSNVHRP